MSLLDELSKRMYYESNRQSANSYIRNRSIQAPEVEDIQEENEDIATTVLLDEFDVIDSIPQDKFENILNQRCRIKEKTYFERAVIKTDRIRCALSLFMLFDMIASFMFNLFLSKTNSEKKYFLTDKIFISERSLVNSLVFGLFGAGMNVGILFALRFKLQKHKFSKKSKQTSTFVGVIICGLFALHEIAFFLADELNLPLFKAILVLIKSILFGLGLMNIITIIFDFKIGNITRKWARRSIRLFILTITLALGMSLLFYQSILKNRDPHWIDSISGDFLLSRVIISVNMFILFYLIWNGMNHLHDETPTLCDNIKEFLKEFDNNNTTSINFESIIALCSNKRKRRRSESINEDCVSMKTIRNGSFVTIEIAGIVIFSLLFTSELSHLLITSQNSHLIYPSKHEFWTQFVLFLTISLFRLLLVFQPVTPTESGIHRELLGHFAWHRNCHKYLIVFIANTIGNILLLFSSSLPVVFLYFANILIGFSLSLMIEKLLAFLSSYITVTLSFFKFAIPASLIFCSVILSLIENLTQQNRDYFVIIFYINLVTSSLSLLQILIISYGSCLHEDDGFDLVEMQAFVNGDNLPIDNKNDVNRSFEMDQTNADRTEEITSISSQHFSDPGPSTLNDNAFRSNSNSHLYWYQVAVKDGRRKSSMAVIATRIKYRLESIASILK